MKDKRDIVIVILVVIIFAGGGYFLGTQNREKSDTTKERSSFSSTLNSSTLSSIKETAVSTNVSSITYESQHSEDSMSQKDIALNKMISLQGKWAVPSTDSFLMIHEDGSWSATTAGLSEPRQLDVKIDSYNAMSDTLYITIGGEAAQIHVITNEKMIIDYNDGTSPREYHLVN